MLTEEQIFDAGVVHGYLIAKQNMLLAEMGGSEFTRRLVEGKVWDDFSRSHQKEAANYELVMSKWKSSKRKKGGS
jgi:hypothetical protein